VGSNIVNVLCILGLSALIVPLTVRGQLLRFDLPLVIGISILTWFLGFDGVIGLVDGIILVLALVTYIVWSIRASRKESAAIQAKLADEVGEVTDPNLERGWRGVLNSLAITAVGLALMIAGSNW